MKNLVIDSDIIIDHLRQGSDILDFIYLQISQAKLRVFMPAVVVTEIHSGKDTRSKDRLDNIHDILEHFEFILADKDISQQAGFLIRDYQNLKLGNAIIAATVLSLKAKLATRNIKDFQKIKGLKFFKLPKAT